MEKMLQNVTPAKRARKTKKDKLIELILLDGSVKQAAETIGISRMTAYRWWDEWCQTDEAKEISAEWWAIFNQLKKEKKEKAGEFVTRLKLKLMKDKSEMELKGESTIIIKSWDPDAKTKSGPSS